MSQRKNWIIVIFIVTVPIAAFLWLTTFTKNHFDIPRFFPEIDSSSGSTKRRNGDTVFYAIPWLAIGDRLGHSSRTKISTLGKISLIYLLGDESQKRVDRIVSNAASVAKVMKTLPNSQTFMVLTDENEELLNQLENKNPIIDWKIVTLSGSEFNDLARKNLRVEEARDHSGPKEAVLIDAIGNIRGFYGVSQTEESERLKVELKILKRNIRRKS